MHHAEVGSQRADCSDEPIVKQGCAAEFQQRPVIPFHCPIHFLADRCISPCQEFTLGHEQCSESVLAAIEHISVHVHNTVLCCAAEVVHDDALKWFGQSSPISSQWWHTH